MKFISARDKVITSSFHDAVFSGIASDGGLFIPETIPSIQTTHANLSLLAEAILSAFISEISSDNLKTMINHTFTFDIPLVHLEKNIYLLEVFHGPTLAFKDVGARFMANVLEFYLKQADQRVAILVATSGDTGSAIAHAFYKKKNIDVYIFYPSGKVTFFQEQQMTTLGGNIHALEVTGTFDDCQRLVKSALMDKSLRKDLQVTTANSINVSRLLPQIIYHAWGLQQLALKTDIKPVLSVPSGNFGNLVSAIYAKQMGFGVDRFIAATNANAIVPGYLTDGQFTPKPSVRTLSNAMDVGNPSNFERLLACYHANLEAIRHDITGISVSDEETLMEIRNTFHRTGYLLDPHTAVGVTAARMANISQHVPIVVTATAHPAKFPEVIRQAIGQDPAMPERLRVAVSGKKQSQVIPADGRDLKSILKPSYPA